MLGRWDEALARAAELEVESLEGGGLRIVLVDVYCARGDFPAAQTLFDHPGLREIEEIQNRLSFLAMESAFLRARGDVGAALERAEEALVVRGDLGMTYLPAKVAQVVTLEAAFELGNVARVEELLDEIEALRPGERPRLLEAHRRRFRGKLSSDEAEFEAAEALFRELSLRFWLAVTLC